MMKTFLDDETDVYVGLSDREATDIEAGDEDGTENDATEYEGTGGVLTFHEDIEMHDGVYQPRDDGMNLVLGQEFRTKEAAKVHIQTASRQNCFHVVLHELLHLRLDHTSSENFSNMIEKRPPRRPKKRPRVVRKKT
ncbi:hypothetical protein F2Q69_00049165 [Brassica cretica]|uniref:Uncharacterized protein n=1 Tax=Brassica cretica TaxID=69181 RepID=A0A8S9PEN0_BRACR|nr:hypothetical protein F2Q69_00049165 [Brassica cretica]